MEEGRDGGGGGGTEKKVVTLNLNRIAFSSSAGCGLWWCIAAVSQSVSPSVVTAFGGSNQSGGRGATEQIVMPHQQLTTDDDDQPVDFDELC